MKDTQLKLNLIDVEKELYEILDFIDEERRKQNLTQAELGTIALAKNSQSHLSKILLKHRPGVEYRVIAKLINALGYELKIVKKA